MKIEVEHSKLIVCTPNNSYIFYLLMYLCTDVFIYLCI